MKPQIAIFCFSFLALPVVIADQQTDDADAESIQDSEKLSPDDSEGMIIDLTDEGRSKRSGKWLTENGASVCDGYLTQVEDEEYCAAEIPDGWRPFTFNGKTYYMQPLT